MASKLDEVYEAIRTEKLEDLKRLLSLGVDVNEVGRRGTPLTYACFCCRGTAFVKTLLDAGANVNISDERRRESPLTVAASQGRDEALRLLLHAGADVNWRNHVGE